MLADRLLVSIVRQVLSECICSRQWYYGRNVAGTSLDTTVGRSINPETRYSCRTEGSTPGLPGGGIDYDQHKDPRWFPAQRSARKPLDPNKPCHSTAAKSGI